MPFGAFGAAFDLPNPSEISPTSHRTLALEALLDMVRYVERD
jgi:hypothetical protein